MLSNDRLDVAQTLLEQPIFHGLTLKDAREFAEVCDTLQVHEGGLLFAEGDDSRELFLVLSGRLRLSCAGPDGTPVIVGTVSDGGLLGEMGVFDGSPRSATAVALLPTVLLRVPGSVLWELVEKGHPVVRNLFQRLRQILCWRLRALDRRLDAALSPYVVGEKALSVTQVAVGLEPEGRLQDLDRVTGRDLAVVPVLRPLHERARDALAGVMVRRPFGDGEHIVNQGSAADGVCLLLQGEVRVVRRLPRQGSVRLVTLGAGAIFGLLAAMDGLHRAADCIAVGEVECAVLSLADFGTLMEGASPTALRFQMAMIQALFVDLRQANIRLTEMSALPELDLGLALVPTPAAE